MTELDNMNTAENKNSESTAKPDLKNEMIEWTKALLIAFAVVVLIRMFIFTPTIVSGPSMLPNFENKERLIVNKLIYYIKEPAYGEVIVFHAPEAKDYIKRVIALPGDTIRVVYDEVYVNGELIDEPYLKEAIEQEHAQGKTYNSTNFKVVNGEVVSVQVPEDHIFVMGDNRSKSRDSRMESVGFVPLEEVVGRVDVVFWPPQAFKIVDHGKK